MGAPAGWPGSGQAVTAPAGGQRLESDYYAYMGFDPEHSRESLAFYADRFPAGPVVDLACGRGEFLDVLAARGVPAYGVDNDDGMVAAAREQGHDVRYGDAVEHLHTEAAPGSLGGVFSAHFLEHLHPAQVERVVSGARRALRPGGVFVAAVPNPACLAVLCYDFWKDPTHVRFYDPRLLGFFCTRAGLTVAETGGNPANVGGPFPGIAPGPVHVEPSLVPEVIRMVQHTAGRGPSPDPAWQEGGHLIAQLADRLLQTQDELAALRRAYSCLVDQLFQPNEVYVVAHA